MSKITDVSDGVPGDRAVPVPESSPPSYFSKAQTPRAGWCSTGRSAQHAGAGDRLGTGRPSALWGSLPPLPAPARPGQAPLSSGIPTRAPDTRPARVWTGPRGKQSCSAVFPEVMLARRRAPGQPQALGDRAELGHLASPPKATVKSQAFEGEGPGHRAGLDSPWCLEGRALQEALLCCTPWKATGTGDLVPQGPGRSLFPLDLHFSACQTQEGACGLPSSREKGKSLSTSQHLHAGASTLMGEGALCGRVAPGQLSRPSRGPRGGQQTPVRVWRSCKWP